MIISILCVDKNFGIGKNNDLLFHLPKDLEYFKKTTLNHYVALGENTLLSFPRQKPLKNRIHILLSKEKNYEGVINTHSLADFLKEIKKHSDKEDVFIIGGASIYKQMLPYVDKIFLTKVDADGKADVFFENIDKNPNFKLEKEENTIYDGNFPLKFCIYKNLNKKCIN